MVTQAANELDFLAIPKASRSIESHRFELAPSPQDLVKTKSGSIQIIIKMKKFLNTKSKFKIYLNGDVVCETKRNEDDHEVENEEHQVENQF